jgi:hypothetical protein
MLRPSYSSRLQLFKEGVMQKLATVSALRDVPVAEDADEVKRPYRLWDAMKKKMVQWRNYKNLRHAHMGALCEAAWSNGDSVYEVFDIRTGGLRGQYRRHGQDIKFWRSTHPIEEE